MEPGTIVPRNELKAMRILATLSVAGVGLTVGGFAYDVYVLATRHLTTAHMVSNVIALIAFAVGARTATKYFGEARAELAALKSGRG